MIIINSLFTIGEVSKIKNISIDALRHYDKIGLLKPEYVDEKTNYRYYGANQFFLIELIQYCKSLEIPLLQIKALLKESNQDSFTSFLMQQKDNINSKINDYLQMLILIDNISKKVADYNTSKKEKGTYFKHVPQRNIVYSEYDGTHRGTNSQITYSQLYNSIAQANMHISYHGGFIHSVEHHQITTKYIFESVSEFCGETDLATKVLPSGNYLCITYCEDNFNERLDLLLQEMEKKQITSKLIIDTYFLDGEFHSKDYLYEIQVLASTPH